MIDNAYKIHVSQSKLGSNRQMNFTIDGNIMPLCRTITRYEFNEARRVRFLLETELMSLSSYFPRLKGPLELQVQCFIPEPKSACSREDYFQNNYHIFKPTLLKLTQAIVELVHKIAFDDSCTIVKITAEKHVAPSVKVSKTQFIISEIK